MPRSQQEMERPPAWHALPALEVLRAQGVDAADGLSPAEAERRRERYGPND